MFQILNFRLARRKATRKGRREAKRVEVAEPMLF